MPAWLTRGSTIIVSLLATAAHAAEPAVSTVLYEDEKVRAYEVRFAPGAEARNIVRPFRVVRALVDGTLERKTADGKIEIEHWSRGQVRVFQQDQVATRNVGERELTLYIVQIK
jgi:hypothetical protein